MISSRPNNITFPFPTFQHMASRVLFSIASSSSSSLSLTTILCRARHIFSNKYTGLRRLSLAYILHNPPAAEPLKTQSVPLIILHGLFGSKQNYRSIILARDLKSPVYAIDLRNHGDSPHDPIHDYAAMAGDVEDFIQVHGLDIPVVIGHSMGAKVAMTMALKFPNRLKALVAVDNAPVHAILQSDFSKYVQGLQEVERAKVSKQPEADEILKKYEKALPVRQFLLTNLIREPRTNYLRLRIPIDVLAANLAHMGGFPFKDPKQAQYEGPTLFIRGTRSRYVNDDVLPLIGCFFPKFELRDIDCGHWVISEKPEAFKEALVDFLSQKAALNFAEKMFKP